MTRVLAPDAASCDFWTATEEETGSGRSAGPVCMLVGLGVGTVVAQRPWEARLLDTSVYQGEAARGTWRGEGSGTPLVQGCRDLRDRGGQGPVG